MRSSASKWVQIIMSNPASHVVTCLLFFLFYFDNFYLLSSFQHIFQTMAEEVLLTVESVRSKKIEGTLCLSHTMIRWFRKNAQQAEITIEYRDIKAQRVSPDTKPKVQLQVTKYNNDSYVFHFATPGNDEESKAKGMANRMAVKEMLSQKLPLHRNQRNQELDVKIQVLQKNDTLYAMYKDLVVNGVMEADEFWSLRQVNALVERRKELKTDGSGDSCSLISGVTKVGVSSSFMSDIKPISDKGQKFILTQDLINDIWRTYPWLKDVHTGLIKNSPAGKKEEVEEKFWKKFFMSSWYERHRIPASNEKVFVDSEPDADYGWLTSAAKEFGASLYADDNEPATLISGQTVQVRSEFDSGDKKYLLQNYNKHSMAILGAQFRKRKIKDGKETNSKNSKLIDGGVVGSGNNGVKNVARRNSVNQASNHIAMSSGSLLQHNRMLESGQSEKMERLSLTEGRIEDFLCGPAGIARHNEVSGIADPKGAIQDWISVCRNVQNRSK